MKIDIKQRARVGHGVPGKFHSRNRSPHWLQSDTVFRRTCLSAMLATCFDMAAANPTAPQVVAGQANFVTTGKTLSITNTPNTIINWNSFSINPDELTRFIQQNANSSVLNRITGQDPSQILGALQSNGKVFLINPNGILFGAGSRVDVNGLVASSLNLSNQDFLSGKLNLSHAAISGNVSNKGSITTPSGGQVFLIAPNVENSGIITSPNGQVMLAAGHSVHLVDSGNPDLHVVLSSAQDKAINLGQIVAQAGKIGIYGALVKQRGQVNADSAVIGENGKVVFRSSGDTLLEAGSITSAKGAGSGGEIHVLGQRVGLTDDAKVDASGVKGGGTVLLGGDFQGKNPTIPNAQFSFISAKATVRADAMQQGDGGRVIVWSDRGTQVYGQIDALGGVQGGNGGLVETSGKLTLDVNGAVIRAASRAEGAANKNGQWLLDPSDVTIVHGSAGSLTSGMFDPPSSTTIGDTQINAALAGGTDVTIQTSGGTGGTGLIQVNGSADANGAVSIVNRGGGTRSLNLSTSGTINIHSGAQLSGQSEEPLSVALTGSSIVMNGDIDNYGGNTVLTGATSLGGTIRNGSIAASGTLTSSSGTLDNVSINGTVNLSGTMFVDHDLTLGTGAALNVGSSSLYFRSSATQHLAGTGTINLAGGALYGGYTTTDQQVQIDSGVTLQGYGSISNSLSVGFRNSGTVIANTTGQSLTINPGSFTNDGALKAVAGNLNLDPGSWSNPGIVAVSSGGTLNLNFDTTTAGLGTITRSGGSINFNGVLDNTNSLLDIGGSGPFGSGGLTALGGTISHGALKSGDSTVLTSSNGTLNNVLLAGTLNTNGSVFVQNDLSLGNGAILNLGTSSLYFKTTGSRHIATGGSSTINMAGGAIYGGFGVTGQTLEIDSGVTVQGYGHLNQSSAITLINSGTIKSNTSGQTLGLTTDTFFNNGSLQVSDGILSLSPTNWNNSGSMSTAGSGELRLGFDTTTAALGSVTRSGGAVHFNGVLDNTAATLDIGSSGLFGSGGLTGLGGTIKNGTLKSSDSTVLQSSNATLDGVTVSGTLDTSGSFFIKGNLTLADAAVLNLGNSNMYFSGGGNVHIATGGSSTINLSGTALYAGYGVNGQTLHLDSGLTVQGHGGLYQSSTATINNAGIINASTAGQTLHLQPGTLNNSGSLQASSGNLTIGDIGWSNSGSISVGSGAVLTLGVDTTSAALGSISRSGGSVHYNGVLDNTGNTLDIGSGGIFGSGGLTQFGGTIKQGTVFSSDSTPLKSNGGTLDNVTVSGNLTVDGTTFIKNDLTLANSAVVNLGNSNWYFNSAGTPHIATSGAGTLNLAGAALYAGYGVSGQTLVIDSGVTLAGHGGLYQSSAATIENNGVIDANVAGQTFFVNPGTLNNAGILRASTGTLTLDPTNWSNNGYMELAASGVLNLNFDTTTANLGTVTRSGGSVHFNGVLDNTAALLDIGAAGPFGSGGLSSLGGTIKNGTIKSGDSTALAMPSGATLDGVTLAGNLTASGTTFIKNGVTLANGSNLDLGNSAWYFTGTGTQHIATSGTAGIQLAGGIWYGGYGVSGQTLQIDTGVTLHGYGHLLQSSPANLVNMGTITANVGAQTLTLNFANISNEGSMRADAADSTLSLSGLTVNSGLIDLADNSRLTSSENSLVNNAGATLAGSGTISLANGGTMTNYGTILPGGTSSVGTLHLTGNFVQGASGNLEVEVGPDALTHDVLAISGSAAFDGALTSKAIGSYVPANGTDYDFINYAGVASGSFATVNLNTFTGATPDYSGTGTFLLRMPNGTVINIWNFDGSGNWSDPTKWSLGHVPTVNEDVQVPDYTSQFTLHIPANAFVAKSVIFVGNDKLAISGGSLNVGGIINLSSGTLELSANGVLSATGSMRASVFSLADTAIVNLATGTKLQALDLNMSGGTIAGAANVEIFNALNRTGGSFGSNLTGIDVVHASGTLSPGSMDIAGAIKLSASAGDIALGHDLASDASITLSATQGAITNTGGVVTVPVLALQARDGIGNGTPLNTGVATLQANNAQSGAIAINNTGSGLNLADLGTLGFGVRQQGSGNIAIKNNGVNALTISAPVSLAGGNVSLEADQITFANSSNAKIDGLAGGVTLRANGSGATAILMPTLSAIITNGNGSSNSNVSLVADSLALDGTINAGLTSGTVRISPKSSGLPIELVSTLSNAAGKLELAGNALQTIQAANLIIGNDSASTGSGAISLQAPLQPHASVNTLILQTGCNGGTDCGGLSQTNSGMISTNNLVLNVAQGVNLNAATNDVANLAASIGHNGNGNGLVFVNGKSLGIGVSGNGITATNQPVDISVTAGSLNLAESITANAVKLDASGSMGRTNGAIYAPTVALSSGNGMNLTTYATAVQLENSGGSADIRLINHGNLSLGKVSQLGSGAIHVENHGPMTVIGPVSSGAGDITLETHSPLTIDGSVTSGGGGDIILRAGASNSASDNLTINSSAVVTTSGSVTLEAGNTITLAAGSTVSPQAKQLPMQNSTLPDINSCVSNPALPRCNEVLPTLSTCMAAPATAGCSVVLPSLATCVSNPATQGCPVVLPDLASCISAPATAGCSVVLPPLDACISSPATSGCTVVLPTLSACVSAPATPGCSVVLPTLSACVSAPATPGCSVVLPTLSACVSAPATPGCSVVLPTLSACVSAPATPGCSVVLPPLATCISEPATPGCSAVLPTILTCIANPSAPGCGAVLPSLASCTTTPTLPGCSVVLPSLTACISNPQADGCSVILPNLAVCISNPQAAGCSVVLPNLDTCVSNPQAAGCSVVLPNLAVCISNPQAPGCSVILPNLDTCVSNPQAAGCSVVLPILATCVSNPQAAGCSVVLPNLDTCVSNPQAAGCSVVLPNLATCISNPQAAGCNVVLPNLAACVSNPQAAGCSVILPNLTACISSPATAGCSVVLPSLAACTATPTLPGCTAVLPNIADCLTNPSASGCQVVITPGDNGNVSDLNKALNNTVDVVTNTLPPTQPVTQPPVVAPTNATPTAPATSDKPTETAAVAAKPGETKEEAKKDEKKEEKKDDSVAVAAKPEAKKEEPARKLYCN